MIISERSQLGLRAISKNIVTRYKEIIEFKECLIAHNEKMREQLNDENFTNVVPSVEEATANDINQFYKMNDWIFWKWKSDPGFSFEDFFSVDKAHKIPYKKYLILDSVWKMSSMIQVDKNFSTKCFKNIDFGYYTYLLGKDRALFFKVSLGKIYGVHFHKVSSDSFEFTINLTDDEILCNSLSPDEISSVLKLMVFVACGDIEVEVIEGHKSNGKPKKAGKISNQNNFDVYVVDSSWNKLIIREDGFGVRGHFRLQPCGKGMQDRKLIWIDSFQKNGYKRRPKAEIVNN